MSAPAWTPGPWHSNRWWWIIRAEGKERPLAIANYSEADARLIAAAPDLADALAQMVEEKADYMRINKLGDPEKQHTIKVARAALAKAEGRT